MGALSSKKKRRAKANITDQDRAQLDLKNSRDRLKRYQKRLDQECSRLQAQALAMVKEGRKDRALLLLKIKKLKQDQANKADSQLLSVYQLMDTIDWETQQYKVFQALKEGNKALTQLHEQMPLETVEELMADTAENIAMEQEISKAIGGSWTDAKEEDLLAELAEIEKEQAPALPEASEPIPEPPVEVPEAVSEPAVEEPEAIPKPADEETKFDGATVDAEAGASLEDLLPEAPTAAPVVAINTASADETAAAADAPALVPA